MVRVLRRHSEEIRAIGRTGIRDAGSLAVLVALLALLMLLAAHGTAAALAAHGLPPGAPLPSWANGRKVHFDPAEPQNPRPGGREAVARNAEMAPLTSSLPRLQYWGGLVENEPRLVLVFWGSGWAGASGLRHELEAMAEGLPGSGYQKILAQYSSFDGPISQGPQIGSLKVEKYYDPRAISGDVGWVALKEEALRAMEQIPAGSVIDTTYAVMPAPGTPLVPRAFTGVCGGHEIIEMFGANSVLEVGEAATIPVTAGGFSCNASLVLSHEYAESVTGPDMAGGWGTPERGENEIADVCNYLGPVRMADGSLVAALWDDSKNACEVEDNNPEPVPIGPFTDRSLEKSTNPSTESEMIEAALEPCDREAHYYFEYGTTTAYGNRTAESVLPPTWGVVNRNATLTGLEHSRPYDWRVVLKTANGTVYSENHEFTIPYYVEVKTGEAEANVGGAKLNGEVQPGGVEAKYYFEYGTTETYGSRTPEASAGSGKEYVQVAVTLASLAPETLYHYRIVAASSRGTTEGQDQTFTTLGGPPAVETLSAWRIGYTEATLTGNVGPKGVATTWFFEYGTTNTYGQRTAETSSQGLSGYGEEEVTVHNLTPDTTYHVRIVATNSYGTTFGPDQTFTTGPEPFVETGTPETVGYSGATLSGVIDPRGANLSYYFEYGKSQTYGQRTAESSAGSGTGDVQETQAVSALTEGSVYHYRVIATNNYGTTYGADRTFSTGIEPLVQTDAPVTVGSEEATLNGTINPHGAEVEYYFEYGVTPEYGTSTAQASAGSGNVDVEAAKTIAHLTPGVTYRYRVVAVYGSFKQYGSELTFTTTALPPLVTPIGPGPVPNETPPPTTLQQTPSPPSVQNARQSTRRWRENKQIARISRARTPTGTTFSFSLNEQATVSFSFDPILGGPRVAHRCLVKTHKTVNGTTCNTVKAGILSFTGHSGTNNVLFAGRISHTNKLKPGQYELTITATNSIGQRSTPVSLIFTIVK
jgi:hypothetical protein